MSSGLTTDLPAPAGPWKAGVGLPGARAGLARPRLPTRFHDQAEQDDKDDQREKCPELGRLQGEPDFGDVQHRPPDHLARRRVERVDRVVVVALHEEPRGAVTADDAVQHDQMAVQVAVVSNDLADVVGAGRGDDHEVAGVVKRLHADPVRDHVTHLPGQDGAQAKHDQDRRDGGHKASPRFRRVEGRFMSSR